MYTRKQKYKLCLKNYYKNKNLNYNEIENYKLEGIPRLIDNSKISIIKKNIDNFIDHPITIKEYEELLFSKKKSLKFDSTIKVILIPEIKE